MNKTSMLSSFDITNLYSNVLVQKKHYTFYNCTENGNIFNDKQSLTKLILKHEHNSKGLQCDHRSVSKHEL